MRGSTSRRAGRPLAGVARAAGPGACALLGVALLALGGCAITPAPPPVPSTAPPPAQPEGTQTGATASGGAITQNVPAPAAPAPVDSTPSPEALAVLRSIPEPLGPAEASRGRSAPGEAEGGGAEVPVPAPTRPLGDRPGARPPLVLPESLSAAPLPPAAPSPSGPPGECWRVQVAAPPERPRAEQMAAAARSQLMVPFVIEREGGLHKVRTEECLTAASADDVRRRALASGFVGAFRLPGRSR